MRASQEYWSNAEVKSTSSINKYLSKINIQCKNKGNWKSGSHIYFLKVFNVKYRIQNNSLTWSALIDQGVIDRHYTCICKQMTYFEAVY